MRGTSSAALPGGAGVDNGAEIPPLQPCCFAEGHGGRRSPTARVHVPPAGAGGMHVPTGISTRSGSRLTGFIPKSAFSDPRKSGRRISDWSLSSKEWWCLWPFSPGLSGLNLLSRHRRPCGSNSVRTDHRMDHCQMANLRAEIELGPSHGKKQGAMFFQLSHRHFLTPREALHSQLGKWQFLYRGPQTGPRPRNHTSGWVPAAQSTKPGGLSSHPTTVPVPIPTRHRWGHPPTPS